MERKGGRTAEPWPYWMLRYVGTKSEAAFWDLIWSVGGSPPYGGVIYEEGGAVYELLEVYRGPGMAPQSAYDAISRHLGGRPDAVMALEVFRLHDRIASDPESFTRDDVQSGIALTSELKHPGAQTYFVLLHAQLAHQDGDMGAAKDACNSVLATLAALAIEDGANVEQLLAAAQNTASFAAMDGDFATARVAARVLSNLNAEDRLGPLREQLLK